MIDTLNFITEIQQDTGCLGMYLTKTIEGYLYGKWEERMSRGQSGRKTDKMFVP